jgi:hypothetical protein
VASADLSRIAAARSDGTIEIWGTEPLRRLKAVSESRGEINALALGRVGTWLAVGRTNGETELFDLAKGRLVKRMPPVDPARIWWQTDTPGWYEHLDFWARDRLLVRATPSSKVTQCLIEVVRIPGGQKQSIHTTHKFDFMNYAVSHDGNLLVTCSWDALKLYDISSGQEIDTFRGQLVGFVSAAFSPDRSRLAAGGWDGSITLWDLATRQQVGRWKGHSHPTLNLCFLEEGGGLLSATSRSRPYETRLWRAPSLAEIDAAEKARASAHLAMPAK